MKNKYVYEIVWEYTIDDSESHRTLVEVSRRSDISAIRRFKTFYKFLHHYSDCPYAIISVRYLGAVMNKCW